MAKEIYIDIERFKRYGFYSLLDTTKAPIGSLRVMKNAIVTDRGGLSPRPGTEVLGSYSTSSNKVMGLYNFRKSFDKDEFLIKCIGSEMQALSKDNIPSDWFKIKTNFTPSKEFGFVSSLVNKDNEDYVIGCNRYDNYFRWNGVFTKLSSALVGGETSIAVDSVLTKEIFYDGTATASSTTTLTVAGTPFATSQWVGLYIHITSGVDSGKISKITSNNQNVLTFTALATDPGSVTFEIRKNAFPASGSVVYAGQSVQYSAIPTATSLTVSSALSAPISTPVTLIPIEYPANPRGNRFTNYLNRIIVGNVRSAIARGVGGALQGYSAAGSYFVSKVSNPFDFGYSTPRIAGEGDIVSTPYGGGDITDVSHQENSAYIFKKEYIESVKYSQDVNDLAIREPLKTGVGSVGKVTKGSDDIYFFTADKRFTSIGRVASKDVKPQTENIGINIQRYLDDTGIDSSVGKGIEYKDKLYLPIKSTSSTLDNDVVLVYNKKNRNFEGIWDLSAFSIENFNDDLVYGESSGPNVYKMLTGNADIVGNTRYAIDCEIATHFMNLTASKSNIQALNSIYVEGYIRGGTTINFEVWKDFNKTPFVNFVLSSNETGFLDGSVTQAYSGSKPLATAPIGAISGTVDSLGRRHFQFRVYFPFEYGNYFSIGHRSSGVDLDYEVIRYGLSLKEETVINTSRIKSI